MQSFRDLKVWQKAHDLTRRVYQGTSRFPAEERFGLTSQIRRASVSIGANIAEGCTRGSDRDFARFLHIALGSASELEYLLLLARDLELLPKAPYDVLNKNVVEVKKMLSALLHKLIADG